MTIKDNMKTGTPPPYHLQLIDSAVKMLIEDYGYPREKIHIEYNLVLTSQESVDKTQKFKADIIVVDSKNQEEIIVEVKSAYQKLYTENNTSKIIFTMIGSELKYGMLFNGVDKYCFKKILGTQVIEIPDIPSFSEADLITEKKTEIQYSQYFFRTCDLLRGKIPYSEYSKILISILYAKFIDEKEFNDTLLKQISSPEQIFQTFEKLFEEGNKKYQFLDVDINTIKTVPTDVLFSIISEANQFSITKTNPESIIQAMYHIIEKESSLKKTGYFYVPESVSLFLYKYLVTGATSSNIKKRKLLLTDIGNGRVVFDVLHHISDEFELVGEDLKEFTRSNLEVVDRNKTIMGFLKFLLTLKGYDKVGIHLVDPILHTDSMGYNGIMGFPPMGVKIDKNLLDSNPVLGIDYLNHYLISMINKIIPSGYFTAIISPSFLFSNSSREARNLILKKCFLRGLVQLPRGTYQETMIPPIIILLQKKSTENQPHNNYKVFMSDLSNPNFISKDKLNAKILYLVWEKFLELQTIDTILDENDTSFSVKISELEESIDWRPSRHSPRIKKIAQINGRPLTDYVDLILSSSGNINSKDESDLLEIHEIRVSDILENGEINDEIQKNVLIPKSKQASIQTVKKDDIVFSIKGTIGKFGIIGSKHDSYAINSNLIILRPKSDPLKILFMLGTDFVKQEIENLIRGDTIKYIRINELKKIIIPDFIFDENIMEKNKKLRNEILNLKKELEKKQKEFSEFWSKYTHD